MTDDAEAERENPFERDTLPVSDADELAGVVDLFGTLTAGELTTALVELAYRRDGTVDEAAVSDAAADAVAWALERYHLVSYAPADVDAGDGEHDAVSDDADAPDETRLTVGPVSFPTIPAEAEDLPHLRDYPTRSVSRASLAEAVETRLRGDAARAVAAEDTDRIRTLLDVTYDLEAWAPVDVGTVRMRLDDALAAADGDADES